MEQGNRMSQLATVARWPLGIAQVGWRYMWRTTPVHRTQEDGGEVSHVALSGSALDIPGFAAALQVSLGVEVHAETIGLVNSSMAQEVAVNRLAVAAGLAAIEVPK